MMLWANASAFGMRSRRPAERLLVTVDPDGFPAHACQAREQGPRRIRRRARPQRATALGDGEAASAPSRRRFTGSTARPVIVFPACAEAPPVL